MTAEKIALARNTLNRLVARREVTPGESAALLDCIDLSERAMMTTA